jgi:cell division protein FtsW (lipid II flippase)
MLVVGFFAVCTVISFAVSRPDSRLMAYLFLSLTVLLAISGLLIRTIAHAARRWRE